MCRLQSSRQPAERWEQPSDGSFTDCPCHCRKRRPLRQRRRILPDSRLNFAKRQRAESQIATSLCPRVSAIFAAVVPSLICAPASAPRSSDSSHNPRSPHDAARCSGVMPASPRAFASAPASNFRPVACRGQCAAVLRPQRCRVRARGTRRRGQTCWGAVWTLTAMGLSVASQPRATTAGSD